ncbi:hypothetical protein AVEN_130883-1 [Araneus ventricosus]|uniref:Uncharacterized protein n=1 Tax=Araneus ventricosus TaxID=182803 RepID=A0A4Y2M1K8_ARAVE|nr:hypothetical protein AVEN_130883-1 [Araneus ventricosus]
MKVILLALAVVLLVSEVCGFFEIHSGFGVGRVNEGQSRSNHRPHGRTSGRQCRGGHHNLFPNCKDFMKEVHNKLRETGSGPQTCRTAHDYNECKYQETMKARMAVNYHPSEECLNQIHNFLTGTPTSGERNSGGSSSW